MIRLITLLFAILVITSCNGQSNKAVKDQQEANKVLEDLAAKGLLPTTEGGWTMTCLIDGKPWKASGLYPLSMSDRIMGIYKDGQISFPVPKLEAGTKKKFGEFYAVDFSPVGNPNFWAGRTGEMEITKADGSWVEGKFFFTATLRGSDQKIEVTNGFFRVAPKKK